MYVLQFDISSLLAIKCTQWWHDKYDWCIVLFFNDEFIDVVWHEGYDDPRMFVLCSSPDSVIQNNWYSLLGNAKPR